MVDIRVDNDFRKMFDELQKEFLEVHQEMLNYRAKYEQLKYELEMCEPFGMNKEYIGKLLERVCKDE